MLKKLSFALACAITSVNYATTENRDEVKVTLRLKYVDATVVAELYQNISKDMSLAEPPMNVLANPENKSVTIVRPKDSFEQVRVIANPKDNSVTIIGPKNLVDVVWSFIANSIDRANRN